MPYLHLGVMNRSTQLSTPYTLAEINSNFIKLGNIVVNDGPLSFFLHRENNVALGFADRALNMKTKFYPIFELKLRPPQGCKVCNTFTNPIQVAGVFTDNDYLKAGIASQVYRWLVERGFTLVSDCAQFESSVRLWKSLARNAKGRYKIRIFDTDYGPHKDHNGDPYLYDGSNVSDDEIWGSHHDSQHWLLVMSKT